VSSAWPSPCEEGNRRGFGRPLGRTGLQARMGEGGWLGRSASAGPRGSGGDRSGWPGRARLPAEFRPTARIKLKIPFLFPNLFIIYKLI
jgi:hypothetical protein